MRKNKISEFCCLTSFGSLKPKWAGITRSAFNYGPQLSLTFKTNRTCTEIWRAEGKASCVPSDIMLDTELCDLFCQTKEPAASVSSKIRDLSCQKLQENHLKKKHCLFSVKRAFRLEEKALCLSLFRTPSKLKYVLFPSEIHVSGAQGQVSGIGNKNSRRGGEKKKKKRRKRKRKNNGGRNRTGGGEERL